MGMEKQKEERADANLGTDGRKPRNTRHDTEEDHRLLTSALLNMGGASARRPAQINQAQIGCWNHEMHGMHERIIVTHESEHRV